VTNFLRKQNYYNKIWGKKMKRLMLGVAIASALGLTACSEESYNELKENTVALTPVSHIAFDPANAVVPLPNDLLFSGTLDGTLAIPGEASGNYLDAKIALGALDGWSTTSPISIAVDLSKSNDGTPLTLMPQSVAQKGAVRLFEATLGGALSADPECKAKPSVSACKIGAELVYGVDFVSMASGKNIVIVPIKPLKPAQSYIYATTDLIMDSAGNSVAASSTYNTLKLDIDTHKLETAAQIQLQTLVNSYEKGIAAAHGVDKASISYSGLFTTQSVNPVFETTKLLMAQGAPYAPSFATMPSPAGYTVAQALGLTPAAGTAYDFADLADVYTAAIKVPMYGECSSNGCLSPEGAALINGRWKAQGDSPVSVLLALQAGTLSQDNFVAQALQQKMTPEQIAAVTTNPALLAGKQFKLNDGTAVDKTKHLTKFNPIPAIRGYETVKVQITLPNAAKLAARAALKGETFVPPTAGWPTTITLHGIGNGKEMALSYAGAYAAAGIATIGIDMPLHGDRSFDANGDGTYEVTATNPAFGALIGKPDAFTKGDILAFINIGSTLSVRDNFRQATMDHLALRLALTGLAQGLAAANQPQIFDVTKISAQGLSLGGIVGTDFATYASTGLRHPVTGEVLPNAYVLNAASLVAPAGGLAGAFAGSASFAPLLFEKINETASFQSLVTEANKTTKYEKGSPEYAALVKVVYAEFIPQFAFAVQTAVDSIDPVNHAKTLTATKLPVHLIEVVGDGNGNLSDQTLPNRVSGFPLSGTEPLISALGLPCVAKTAAGSGAVRFSKGHHNSIWIPNETSATDGMAAQATAEMQTQVASYAASAGMGAATIVVTNPAVIATCG
jgi:Pla-1/cef family extracellular lipase